MEDLKRLVGIERDDRLRDRVQVPVDEGAESPVVVEGARSRATRDEELEAGSAERVLGVDEQETDPSSVGRGALEVVLLRPRQRTRKAGLVVDAPNVSHTFRIEVGRERKLA